MQRAMRLQWKIGALQLNPVVVDQLLFGEVSLYCLFTKMIRRVICSSPRIHNTTARGFCLQDTPEPVLTRSDTPQPEILRFFEGTA